MNELQTMRRVSVRLLPVLFALYICAYLDRVNVGIAALQMNSELKFSSAVFGFGAGIFFIGYALLEVPSNLILTRVGARRWFARIAITWGLLACLMIGVRTPAQFYVVRFLLGVAEAGFFPGVIYYLGHWFPDNYRARALSAFIIGIPVGQALGGPIGGVLLELRGVSGLSGWQWLFLMEGLPSIILGLVVLGYLTEHPKDAAWLSAEERDWLTRRIVREQELAGAIYRSPLRALANPLVWVLAFPFFVYLTVSYAIAFWTPLLVRDAVHTADSTTAFITGAIGLVGVVAFPAAGILSDRSGERCRLVALGLLVGCAGCIGVALLPHSAFRIAALLAFPVTAAMVHTSFWCLPTRFLAGASAAAGLALINSPGSVGGFFGPTLVGVLRHATGSDTAALFTLAALEFSGALVCVALRRITAFSPVRDAPSVA